MAETRENRLKRLRLRCWRRGMKEMDLILGGYADAHLADLDDAALDALEAMMAENDQDLYVWVTGQQTVPAEHMSTVEKLRNYHKIA